MKINATKHRCPKCDYLDLAKGIAWRSIKPFYGFNTFACNDCRRLSQVISEKGEPSFTKTGVIWDYRPVKPQCGWCGSENVSEWIMENPMCPKCGDRMTSSGEFVSQNVLNIGVEDIEDVAKTFSNLVIMVTASYDPLGGITLPFFDEIISESDDIHGGIIILEDNEASEQLSEEYKIHSLPTFLIFQNGVLKGSFSGSRNKPELKEEIEKVITTDD